MDTNNPIHIPSEVEKLQVKCLRLENKVKTLKDVSSIRQNLLELRERESKNLIQRLKHFEDEFNEEKNKRIELANRMQNADLGYQQLNEKLSDNVIALDEAKAQYEKRVRGLAIQLDESAELFQKFKNEKSELEAKLIFESKSYQSKIEILETKVVELEQMKSNDQTKIKALESTVSEQKQLIQKLETKLLERSKIGIDFETQTSNNVFVDEEKDAKILQLEEELKISQEKTLSLSYQMSLLNTLFNETEGTPIDFQRIKAIGDIVRESCVGRNMEAGPCVENEATARMPVMLDVAGFMERLEEAERVQCPDIPGQESCYKSVDTTAGPELVLSVSRTFIKLKDLILEKRSLQQEIDGLKQLNSKLESKVDTQSRRLYHVSLELNKTWKLVSKLKAQHGQLHNTKAVLRYELQEKRRMLEKLKRELNLSREKCIRVRQKNCESQLEWESIRDEFARRRAEICKSTESAFFEDESSTASITEEGLGEENVESDEGTTEKMACAGVMTIEDKDDEMVLDGFVVDLEAEIDSIEAEVEETEDPGDNSNLTYEELINRRAHRLRELEEQCRLLYSKLQLSTARNTELASKLANLHSHYGSENSPEENSVVEGDEIGFLSETSGDTAYASTSGHGLLQSRDDETEIPSENEDEDEQHLLTLDPTEDAEDFHHNETIILDSDTNASFPVTSAVSQITTVADPEQNLNYPSQESDIRTHSSETDGRRRSFSNVPNPSTEDRRLIGEEVENNSIQNQRSGTSMTLELLAELRRTIDAVVGDENEEIETPPFTHTTYSTLNNFSCEVSDAVNETSSDSEYPNNEGEGEIAGSSPSELNMLSKLIKQLPKILDALKKENLKLKTQAVETGIVMKETQLELEDQKHLLGLLQPQILASVNTEMELRNELELKQRLIQELTSKIQIATENYDTINREHGRMAEYFKIKMQEAAIQEQRKLVKMRTKKECTKCSKKFTLFKRRIHCSTCGHAFCSDCLLEPFSTNMKMTTPKKILVCNSCFERKRKLDAVVEQNLTAIEL